MAERQLPKLHTRVRFPSPAPFTTSAPWKNPAEHRKICIAGAGRILLRNPSPSPPSIAHPHIISGGVADWRQGSVTWMARRDFFARLAGDPFDPVRPPASFMIFCGGEPIL